MVSCSLDSDTSHILNQSITLVPRKTSKNFLKILVSPDSPTVDIVAVHGLNPLNKVFHAEGTWTVNEKLWLRDFLPSAIPGARVLLFGYNSNVAFETSVAGVTEQSLNLLNRLKLKREDAVDRPIVFVAHSLGGIVVKKALVEAQLNESYLPIRKATYGIAFFGTPHQGGNFAKLGDIAASICTAVVQNPQNTFMEVLKKDSLFSDEIIHNFRHQLEDYHILSFYETSPSQKLGANVGLIVDKKSATLGLPGKREEQIGLEATHSNLCKFADPDDDNYEQVIGNLKSIVRDAEKAFKLQQENEVRNREPSENELKCLQSLYKSNYKQHKARNPHRIEGTCEWFTRHPKYFSWRRNNQSDLLWLTADAGCGKSVLSSFVIDRLTEDSKLAVDTIICYFFFKDDFAEQKTTGTAFSSILHQIITQNMASLSHAFKEFQTKGAAFTNEFNSLWDILLSICNDAIGGRNVICILDGLDECEEKNRIELIQALEQWHARRQQRSTDTHWSLKILITSRPTIRVSDQFVDFPTIRLRAEDEAQAISNDIELVVRYHIARMGRRRSLSAEQQSELIAYILQNADRTFLWVTLVLERIEKSSRFSRKALKELVESMPPDLYGVFEKILSESPNSGNTRKLLGIILAAFRPLSLEEMNSAFVIASEDRYEKDLDIEPDMESTLKLLCGVFVRVTGSRVYLVHQTAREFLLTSECIDLIGASHTISNAAISPQANWRHTYHLQDTNRLMAGICRSYLMLNDIDERPLIISTATGDSQLRSKVEEYAHNHPLLWYSARYWAEHLTSSSYQVKDHDLYSFVDLYNTDSNRFRTWFQIYWNCVYEWSLGSSAMTPLIVASHFGHSEMIKLLLPRGQSNLYRVKKKLWPTMGQINARDDDAMTALSHAADYGRLDAVKILLEQQNIDVNCEDSLRRTPLIRAAKKGHTEIVKTLLRRRDILPDSCDDRGYTALYYAAAAGNTPIVRLLLERNDVDINFSNQYGHNSFDAAVSSSSIETVKFFLSRPELKVTRQKLEDTLVPSAASSGVPELLELISGIAAKISPEVNIAEAFRRAARDDRLAIAQQLLARDPNCLNSTDDSGYTALHLAAHAQHPAIVKFLLEQPGIDANRVDNYGGTALSSILTRYEGDQERAKQTVGILLRHRGIDVTTTGSKLGTLVLCAASYGCSGGLESLLEYDMFEVNHRDEGGYTALNRAASSGYSKAVDVLLTRPDVNVNIPDHSGWTPLMWAANLAFKDIVHSLLARQDLNALAKDQEGRTAMQMALSKGHTGVCNVILLDCVLKAGVDISTLSISQLASLGLRDD